MYNVPTGCLALAGISAPAAPPPALRQVPERREAVAAAAAPSLLLLLLRWVTPTLLRTPLRGVQVTHSRRRAAHTLLPHRGAAAAAAAAAVLGGELPLFIAAQLEIESKTSKRFIIIKFQALRYRRFQHGFHGLNLHHLTCCMGIIPPPCCIIIGGPCGIIWGGIPPCCIIWGGIIWGL